MRSTDKNETENVYKIFKPQLTPKKMMELGVFGGAYFGSNTKEYPRSWFKNAKLSKKFYVKLNRFKIKAGLSRQHWIEKGWIFKEDPLGWFQWYCRYYLGRRCLDDERQIKRWKVMSRHIGQIKKNCRPRDLDCRRRQRQALLHWAYDSRII